jgi:hypothetical protein
LTLPTTLWSRGGEERFSRAEVLALLNIPESALDALSRRGELPCMRWIAPGANFETKILLEFLRRHRVARREAIVEGCSVREA